ncbi:MAG: RNA polymerase sigma factor [Planctomycetes bacterium]|jgi:RNA polymerase sigma-70 factor (ECF subfamily)|nr:RNA polymerase sigma factor [Planctomycetota bacterium]
MTEDSFDGGVLVLRCQRGDPEAFRELVHRWEPRLYYYLRRILPDDSTVWDVLQETWLAVFRDLRGLTDVHKFPAWLYRVSRAKAVDSMRRQNRCVEPSVEDQIECAEDGSLILVAREEAQLVHGQLVKLSPIHREVLTLRFLEEFSIKEISEILSISEGTVRSRLHYAKKALSHLLREAKHEDAA